jgi:protein TonB
VVTGYGTGEEKEFDGTKWELTEPVGGKKAYKNYLEKNLRYPEVALENNIQGKVTIQFTVEPSGQLTDFRVVKSLGSQCDEELIRLIKSGPKWTATKRNDEPVKSKAKVKMRFSLPKKK